MSELDEAVAYFGNALNAQNVPPEDIAGCEEFIRKRYGRNLARMVDAFFEIPGAVFQARNQKRLPRRLPE